MYIIRLAVYDDACKMFFFMSQIRKTVFKNKFVNVIGRKIEVIDFIKTQCSF